MSTLLAAKLENVALQYGDVTALDDVTLEIPGGCMVGLIGPDGVGKSSLLSLISCARKIQKGRIEVLGEDIGDAKIRNALLPRVAYMPQGLGKNLYPTLSVAENIDFFGRLFGQDRKERERRIDELTEATGLFPFKDRPAGKLSGGMKQKLGLCCSLVHDPDLLILDEPTTGVDPLSRRQFWELIDSIRKRRPHMSVLVATAYMEEAQQFDWLAAMYNGKVIATGTPEEMMKKAGKSSLEQAFIQFLPEERRQNYEELVIPPLKENKDKVWAIEADGLTQVFGDFVAVDHVSFKIAQGEIFGFLGSNGCGKTTTMKMLTGLLPPTSGTAETFGKPVDAKNTESRKDVGYMSQSFSLYGELTVMQNLDLHARLFHLPPNEIHDRVQSLIDRFGLQPYVNSAAAELPLGIRQRLSLAVAVVHNPKLLILDEPTSGVDPIARDDFWRLLVEMSREQNVTIFISTHFMNEAERCDRISLMNAGKVLASGTPKELQENKHAATLEEAFIDYLEEAAGSEKTTFDENADIEPEKPHEESPVFSLRRLLAYAARETLELRRDPIRLGFALLGSLLLFFVLGGGISMDVEDLKFAVLDYDQSPQSRDYVHNIAGSRYFLEQAPLKDSKDLEKRMESGKISVAIEIPPNFGRDLEQGRRPEIAAWIDGAMPYRGETILGYIRGLHAKYLEQLNKESNGTDQPPVATLEKRYRYNQDFKSIYAMVPAIIPLLLMLIPAVLMALGIVREKELGSITNLYVTPVTKLEFLLGKQLPYIVLSMISYFLMVACAVWFFGVPVKGSFLALTLGALLYVTATTGLGLVISSFTSTQISALFGTAILTMLPTTQFSGLKDPIGSLEGAAYWIGKFFPASHFIILSRGVFTKALQFSNLIGPLFALAAFIPVLTFIAWLFLPKQEK
ncbi:ribosome-associated ATPase/putative transporter RbbA [Oxalobacter paraformigenes]|uniref:Multidrug ABC transporter ATP-binding protein n=1 Tax=Oxalobacter paraformigenes TaxID=556268 RepID=C3X214_9BURK|nr:ribosome-associated ATPase/putative transporter RbbA [Oxalobacter paraformigenes]EEO27250.1 hypothetical protein OFAG_00403 [Oxalobacter paraformigenes]